MSSELRNEALRATLEATRVAYAKDGLRHVSTIRWTTVIVQQKDGYTVELLTVGSVPGGILREMAGVASLEDARAWIRERYGAPLPTLLFLDAPARGGRELIALDLDTFGPKEFETGIVAVEYGMAQAAA